MIIKLVNSPIHGSVFFNDKILTVVNDYAQLPEGVTAIEFVTPFIDKRQFMPLTGTTHDEYFIDVDKDRLVSALYVAKIDDTLVSTILNDSVCITNKDGSIVPKYQSYLIFNEFDRKISLANTYVMPTSKFAFLCPEREKEEYICDQNVFMTREQLTKFIPDIFKIVYDGYMNLCAMAHICPNPTSTTKVIDFNRPQPKLLWLQPNNIYDYTGRFAEPDYRYELKTWMAKAFFDAMKSTCDALEILATLEKCKEKIMPFVNDVKKRFDIDKNIEHVELLARTNPPGLSLYCETNKEIFLNNLHSVLANRTKKHTTELEEYILPPGTQEIILNRSGIYSYFGTVKKLALGEPIELVTIDPSNYKSLLVHAGIGVSIVNTRNNPITVITNDEVSVLPNRYKIFLASENFIDFIHKKALAQRDQDLLLRTSFHGIFTYLPEQDSILCRCNQVDISFSKYDQNLGYIDNFLSTLIARVPPPILQTQTSITRSIPLTETLFRKINVDILVDQIRIANANNPMVDQRINAIAPLLYCSNYFNNNLTATPNTYKHILSLFKGELTFFQKFDRDFPDQIHSKHGDIYKIDNLGRMLSFSFDDKNNYGVVWKKPNLVLENFSDNVSKRPNNMREEILNLCLHRAYLANRIFDYTERKKPKEQLNLLEFFHANTTLKLQSLGLSEYQIYKTTELYDSFLKNSKPEEAGPIDAIASDLLFDSGKIRKFSQAELIPLISRDVAEYSRDLSVVVRNDPSVPAAVQANAKRNILRNEMKIGDISLFDVFQRYGFSTSTEVLNEVVRHVADEKNTIFEQKESTLLRTVYDENTPYKAKRNEQKNKQASILSAQSTFELEHAQSQPSQPPKEKPEDSDKIKDDDIELEDF